MDNKFRRPRVSKWEKDGRFISVEYTQENGERVKGVFERIGWDRPPNRLLVKFHEAMRNGPIHIIGSKSAYRQALLATPPRPPKPQPIPEGLYLE
jgi:hypothetical protein